MQKVRIYEEAFAHSNTFLTFTSVCMWKDFAVLEGFFDNNTAIIKNPGAFFQTGLSQKGIPKDRGREKSLARFFLSIVALSRV